MAQFKHVNIDEYTHRVIKIVAAQKQLTIGEVLAEAVLLLPEVRAIVSEARECEEAPCASTPEH